MNNLSPSPETNVVKVDPTNPQKQHLFQVSSTLEETRALNLWPVYLSLGLNPSAFPRELGGVPEGELSPFSLSKSVFDTAIRGSGQFADQIWFFKGDSYFRYFENADGKDRIEGPFLIAPNWRGWPQSFATGIDAALCGTGNFEGKIWFFKGSQYLRYDLNSNQVDLGPSLIANNWFGLPAGGIDAAIHGVGSFFGVAWFFKGSQYLRYIVDDPGAEDNVWTPISPSWGLGTWPATFEQGIDFAFYATGANAEKIYFFRGDQYILYNLKTDLVEEGPKPIVKNWRNFVQFMPLPQLFLVEQYALRTFHGEMGRGPTVQGQHIQVAPRARTEFFILTKKSETVSTSTSSNILESQSEQAANAFSDAVRRDESESGSEEKYDYNLDASFHGEAQATLGRGLGGGEVDADSNVKSAAQDVRKAFAKGVINQTEEQRSKTHEDHRQQIETAEASHVVNDEIETGFKQVIDNTENPNPLNCVIFQLTQEYIVVLSLVDIKLAFHNGNPRQSRVVPIRDRDIADLLDECIVEPQARARLTTTLKDVLQNIIDHAGRTRSLIVLDPNEPTRFQIDGTLTSTFEVLDSSGSPLRSITVPGIILNVDRPVVLTTNTAMALLEIF